MNKNIEKLLNLIKENPSLPIIPMVNYEVVVCDEHSYWLSSFGKCEVTKMYIDDERVWFEDDFEDLADLYFNKRYDGTQLLEEIRTLEKEAEEAVKNYPWENVIVVYIELP